MINFADQDRKQAEGQNVRTARNQRPRRRKTPRSATVLDEPPL